jgi:hypothetical protein
MSESLPTIRPCLLAQASVRGTLTSSPNISSILPRARSSRIARKPIRQKIPPLWRWASSEVRRAVEHGPSVSRQSNDVTLLNGPQRQGGNITAEIAIINRSAVTLAADSAVTLNVRGAEKVYTSADKLFELSTYDPIGIMIYNNLDFMGIPIDVAIKRFRDLHITDHYPTVIAAADAFFDHLENYLSADPDAQKQNGRHIVLPVMRQVRFDFDRAAGQAVAQSAKDKRKRPNYPQLLTRTINTFLQNIDKLPISSCFSEIGEGDILELYSTTFDESIDAYFSELPISDDHKDLLRKLMLTTVTRDTYSDSLTGIVFAGFGKNETFPSMISFEMDGMIANRLKKIERQRVVTTRAEMSAEVIPFAQREMVDRFLYGVDPEFEDGIEEFVKTVIQACGDNIIKAIPRTSKATKAKLSQSLADSADVALEFWRKNMIPKVKGRFRQQIQDMLLLMPKPEMANLAEALVNLTSVKRKFSAEKETVAGPIDVAIISRTDGFMWVKRKH